MKVHNVVQMLQNTVLKNPDKPAMLWKNEGTYKSLTYANFWKRIQNFANGLLHLGVKPNDKVAIISNSNFMWGISDFALASIQSVSVPIYPTIPTEQVAYILDNTDIKYAIVENEEQFIKVKDSGIQLEKIIMMFSSQSSEHLPFTEVEELGEKHQNEDWETLWKDLGWDQLLTIMNTSGTTGNPKGVMLTHGNILSNIEGIQFWVIELLPEDISLSYLPLSHIFERLAGHYLPLSIGVTIGYAENINTIPDDLQEIRPTVITSVPHLFEKVFTQIMDQINNGSPVKKRIFDWAVEVGKEKYNYYLQSNVDDYLSQSYLPKNLYRKWKIADKLVYQTIKDRLGGRLRGAVSGGGTLNKEIAKFFWSLDIPLMEGYGLTETSPIISCNPMLRAKVGTVGKVLPNLELKIADDGEILVQGPSITQGYYNDQEETEKSFEGKWFKTGDIGELDEEGYLKIIDRKKRLLILSTGMNVAPAPIESKINESIFIAQTLILGDNQKYVTALINLDYETLIPWAQKQGINTENKEALSKDPLVQKLINDDIVELTKEFTNYAKPKRVTLISDEWSVDSGELTPKLSLKTNIIKKQYEQEIKEMYKKNETKAEAI